ncbi:hypothetical protein JOD21_000353 [Jeotgalibacillus terrae]|nr:hypothetical protein [Jeotgalibacillus terrae]
MKLIKRLFNQRYWDRASLKERLIITAKNKK